MAVGWNGGCLDSKNSLFCSFSKANSFYMLYCCKLRLCNCNERNYTKYQLGSRELNLGEQRYTCNFQVFSDN